MPPPGAGAGELAEANGKRAAFGRLFRFLRLSEGELRGLEEAARQGALADASEGEFRPPQSNTRSKLSTGGRPCERRGGPFSFERQSSNMRFYSSPQLTDAAQRDLRRTVLPFAAATPAAADSKADFAARQPLRLAAANTHPLFTPPAPETVSPEPEAPPVPKMGIPDAAARGVDLLSQVGQRRLAPEFALEDFVGALSTMNLSRAAAAKLTETFAVSLQKAAAAQQLLQQPEPTVPVPAANDPQPVRHSQQSPTTNRSPVAETNRDVVGTPQRLQVSEEAEAPLFEANREDKGDLREAPASVLEKTARFSREVREALTRKRGPNDRTIAEGIDLLDQITEHGIRELAGATLGDEAVNAIDTINGKSARFFAWARTAWRRRLEEIGVRDGLSKQTVADLQEISDAIIVVGATIAPGAGGKRRNGPNDDAPLSVTPGLPVVKVRTERLRNSNARRGTREWEMLNNPEPLTIYELDNGETFRTNKFGFTEEIVFTPSLDKRGRDRRQTKVGHQGGDDDIGGHLRACALGGSCDKYNLIIQDGSFNNGVYRIWENIIRQNIENVEAVKITVIRNDPKSMKPDKLRVEWDSDGDRKVMNFVNRPGGQ